MIFWEIFILLVGLVVERLDWTEIQHHNGYFIFVFFFLLIFVEEVQEWVVF